MTKYNYFVYIVTNHTNSLTYIGVTNNIARRTYEHRNKLVKGFSSKYNLTKLIYIEEYYSIIEAITREKQLKNWHKEWKWNLIKKSNPQLRDLYDTINS